MNLAELPTDIMQMIFHIDENSLFENARLISRSWNTSVQAYLREPRNKVPLEQVQLRIAKMFSDYETVVMTTRMPTKYGARVGVGKWLTLNRKTGEISSSPQRFNVRSSSANAGLRNRAVAARFSRFFSMGAHIDTLVLVGFSDWSVLDDVLRTMGNIRVKRLVLRTSMASIACRTIISDLLLRHRLEHVSVENVRVSVDSPLVDDAFVNSLIKSNVTLELCDDSFFASAKHDWNEKNIQLKKEGISLKFEETVDASHTLLHHTKRRVSIMTIEQCNNEI